MASFNRVTQLGNMTRDPQLKYLPNQTPVCEFGIATNRKYSVNGEQREEVCFVDCAAFGKAAEIINQYTQKGSQIFIEGRLKFDSWDDKNGGGKRSKLSIVVDNFQFIGGRREGGDDQQQGGQGRQQQGRQQGNQRQGGGGNYPRNREDLRNQAPPDEPFDSNESFGEDDIPF